MGLREVIGGVREVAATMLQMAVRKEQEKKICGKRFCPAPCHITCLSLKMDEFSHPQLPVPRLADFNLTHSPPSRNDSQWNIVIESP